MRGGWLILASLSAVALGKPVLGHHSFAMFDQKKEITLVGTVKEVQWSNPHIWVQVLVPDQKGQAVEWSIEGASLNTVKRWGWKRADFKEGEKVTLIINPMRDGSTGGSLKMMRSSTGGAVWGASGG